MSLARGSGKSHRFRLFGCVKGPEEMWHWNGRGQNSVLARYPLRAARPILISEGTTPLLLGRTDSSAAGNCPHADLLYGMRNLRTTHVTGNWRVETMLELGFIRMLSTVPTGTSSSVCGGEQQMPYSECGAIDGVSSIHGLGYQPHIALWEYPLLLHGNSIATACTSTV